MTTIEKLKFKWEILFEEHIRLEWDDFIDKYFISPWERFQVWRRKRNPELVELDAFRETVRIEKKLKDYPNAVPLLTDLIAAYKITGEEDKLLDVMRRLRDINPPTKIEEWRTFSRTNRFSRCNELQPAKTATKKHINSTATIK